jgi:hypothetical protein
MLEKNNNKKSLSSFFSSFNKCHSIMTYFISFLFIFQLLKLIMKGNLVLALLNVLIIEHFFKNFKQCVIKVIKQGRPPIMGFLKMG